LCRSDSQEARNAWAVQIVLENKTGCGYAKNAAQKSAGRNACSATGLFPVLLVAAKLNSPFSDRSGKRPPESGRYIAPARPEQFRPAGTREALPGTNAAS